MIPEIKNTSALDIDNILRDFKCKIKHHEKHHLGYPYNLADAIPQDIIDFLKFSINNLGDPFIESNYAIHSREFEIAVLDWFADLWKINRDDYWGYVTGSGSEGNLEGIYLGRENFPNAVLIASDSSHYSVFKAARMFRITCEQCKSNSNGSIDISEFENIINQKFIGLPIIVNVNIGTTMKEGVDDLDAIIKILQDSKRDFYIHCDGALSGIQDNTLTFEKPIGSISVSGHKFLGSPIPCGIVITRKHYIQAFSQNIDYINSRDATIMGSRNGHAPIFLWYQLVKKQDNLDDILQQCQLVATYFVEKLIEAGVQNVNRNPNSLTITFNKPNEILIKKWQLACSDNICHVVVMPNVTKDKVHNFIFDMICSSTSC